MGATNKWSTIEEDANVFEFMVAIRKQVCSTDTSNHYNSDTLAKVVGNFYKLIQHYNQTDNRIQGQV